MKRFNYNNRILNQLIEEYNSKVSSLFSTGRTKITKVTYSFTEYGCCGVDFHLSDAINEKQKFLVLVYLFKNYINDSANFDDAIDGGYLTEDNKIITIGYNFLDNLGIDTYLADCDSAK